MTNESFMKCLKIMENHVTLLEENKNDGLLSKEDYEYFINAYKKGIEEGYAILKETN